MPAPLDWPICLMLALTGGMTFALVGCSLRRMRSRDRRAVMAWWFATSCTAGGGLWATWALGLVTAMPPPTAAASPQFQALWLGILAACAVAGICALHMVARMDSPDALRGATHAAIFALTWASMYECVRHSLQSQTPFQQPVGMPWLPLVLATFGCAAAFWFTCGARWRSAPRPQLRLWLAASGAGLLHAVALLLAVRALRLPEAASPTPAGAGAGAGTLLLFSAVALVVVGVSLVCVWLDGHAHRRNRALAESLKEANRRLHDQAHSDPLTRMPNRLMFEGRMRDALAAAGNEQCGLAVLFIDLDGFKPINDSFGHVAGDAVLREIGARLKAMARPEDTVARIGGDEFLLMTVRPGHESVAASIAQRVLKVLSEPMTLPNEVTVNLSASIGIVMYPEHGPATKLIANADAAMYAAKRAGGSTYAFFEPRMELDARDQLALQVDLRGAIEREELQLFYQPKIDGRSGQITGVESLLRWQHATRGFVAPDHFIPIAERFGLIGTIGNWVIEQACRQLRDWSRQGLRMRVSVNLSVHQLRQEDLVQRIQLAVARFGIDAQLLTFEITETVAMEDTQETMKAFSQLAAIGVSLSIDDFGTGYSSLSYLRKLPARQLKIDKSFVQDLGQSQDALAVVDAVIRLAHALGLRVVAEGVETARQRDILLGLQCDELQGFLFARPMHARALTLWAMGDGQETGQAPVPPGRDDFRPSLFMEDEPGTDLDILQ